MPVPQTAEAWDAETSVFDLLRAYRGHHWHRVLRLFACACARRVWADIPEGVCRGVVLVAERHALGNATDAELRAAAAAGARAVREAQRVPVGTLILGFRAWEGTYQYGTLKEAVASVAWSCAFGGWHPATNVCHWAQRVVYLKSYRDAVGGRDVWSPRADRSANDGVAEEQRWQVARLRELVGNPYFVGR